MLSREKPAFYIPHGGGPCFFMDWDPPDAWNKTADYLRSIQDSAGEVKAAVVISAHWEEKEFTVCSGESPDLYYDYFGFPAHTYEIQYPAPGSPDLARRIHGLLEESGIKARLDANRPFDHGVFIPFKLIYPKADVPIVQLSLKAGLDPLQHWEAGRAIASLRSEGVVIVGSGMSFHNMRGFSGGYEKISEEFDAWLTDAIAGDSRKDLLVNWEKAQYARDCHPREEHLLPLMVAAGAAEKEKGRRVFSDFVMNTRISGFQFG